MEKQKKFNVEEYHRGEWLPLMVNNKESKKVQKHVKITQEQADNMNKYSLEYKIRYVADQGKDKKADIEHNEDKIAELRAEYEVKFNKKPFAGWKEDKLIEKLNEKQ